MKFNLEEHKRKNRDRVIKHAISSWTDKKNGIYRWFENKRYPIEYCEEQIEYFKKLKL